MKNHEGKEDSWGELCSGRVYVEGQFQVMSFLCTGGTE